MLKHPRTVRVKTSVNFRCLLVYFSTFGLPMTMFQVTFVITDGDVELLEYEASPSGIIKSFQDRFPSESTLQVLQDLWNKEQPYFSS